VVLIPSERLEHSIFLSHTRLGTPRSANRQRPTVDPRLVGRLPHSVWGAADRRLVGRLPHSVWGAADRRLVGRLPHSLWGAA